MHAALEELRHEQKRLAGAVAALEHHPHSASAPHDGTGVAPADPVEPPSPAQDAPVDSGEVSEQTLAHWMNESLQVAQWNAETTTVATEQAEAAVAAVPGMVLDGMLCGDRFCKATFADEAGGTPDIAGVFGVPPFVNEGFAVEEPDGRMTLYFTQPGQSLSDLRRQARVGIHN